MVDQSLITWDEYSRDSGFSDLMTKAKFKTDTSVFLASRGTKLTAIGRALAAYHGNRSFASYTAVKTAFRDWRKEHGGNKYTSDRRNGSGAMKTLNDSIRNLEFVQLSDEAWLDMCTKKLSTYPSLEAIMGKDRARELCLLIKGPFYFDQQANAKRGLEATLTGEVQKIQAAQAHIEQLAIMAKMGTLSDKLLRLQRDMRKFVMVPMAEIATQWVMGGSQSIGTDKGKAQPVRSEFARLGKMPRNWMSLDLCVQINKNVAGQDALKKRRPHSEAPYPSYLGGRTCLEFTFEVAKTFRPMNKQRWWNYSLFLFGAIVRSHGFGDGNGRTARVMSAGCSMEKRVFMMLTKQQEYFLSQMKEGGSPKLTDSF